MMMPEQWVAVEYTCSISRETSIRENPMEHDAFDRIGQVHREWAPAKAACGKSGCTVIR